MTPEYRTGGGERIGPFLRGRRVETFNREQQRVWRRGHWHHGNYRGRYGWWWVIPGSAFFYGVTEPVLGIPDEVPETVVEEPAAPAYLPPALASAGDAATNTPALSPDGYWYWCDPLGGYFPMVAACPVAFRRVPPTQ